jgi:hypothetical protein
MFLRKPNMVLALVCLALSIGGFYGFYINARPIPGDLLTASGLVASAEAGQRRGRSSIHTVWFTLEGRPERFDYPGILPRIRDVWDQIEVGSPVEVMYAIEGGSGEDVELWALSISGVPLLSPAQAREARLKNGYFALIIGFAFAGCAVYTWRQVLRGRPA